MARIVIFKVMVGITGALLVGAFMFILTDGGVCAGIADIAILVGAILIGFWLTVLYAGALVRSWDRRILFTEQTDASGERIVSPETAAMYRMKPLGGIRRWIMEYHKENKRK